MKRRHLIALLAALCMLLSALPALAAPWKSTDHLDFRYVDAEEARELILSRDTFYAQVNQKSLDYFTQKKNATMEEFKELCAQQVLDVSPECRQRLDEAVAGLEEEMYKRGIRVPEIGQIRIVVSKMGDALGAAGYTSDDVIYLFEDCILQYELADLENLLAHELAHCMSRKCPEYREAMYSLIHFRMLGHEIEIPDEIYSQVIANPDVEHHDSVATFTVDGKPEECYLVFLCDGEFEKPGDSFFSTMKSGVVTLDGNRLFYADDVPDFYDVVGRNTTYCEDPEECMATNLAFAMAGAAPDSGTYETPELIEGILKLLSE